MSAHSSSASPQRERASHAAAQTNNASTQSGAQGANVGHADAPGAGHALQDGSERQFHLSEAHRERAYDQRTRRLTQGLGLFSIGLGAAELAAPRAVARLSGIGDAHDPRVVRAMGAREVVTGLGLLSGRATSRWMQGRVAGDVLDLGVLSTAHSPIANASPRRRRPQTGRMLAAGAVVLGVTALDVLASRRAQQAEQRQQSSTTETLQDGIAGNATTQEVRKVITVNRPVEEVYAF